MIGPLQAAAASGLLCAVIGIGVGSVARGVWDAPKLANAKTELETERRARTADRLEWQRKVTERLAAAMQQIQLWQSDAAAAHKELADERERSFLLKRELAVAARDRDTGARLLRDALAARARAPAGATDDSVAACRADAAALEAVAAGSLELLGRGAGLLEQVAGDHDARAAEVVALLRAWPSNITPTVRND